MSAAGPVAVAFRRVPRDPACDLGALAPCERALVAPGAAPKRRAEFAAGRRAAHAALARLLGPAAAACTVARDREAPTGRPIAVSAAGAPLPVSLSISHAAGVAAAIAAREPVGLDLVLLEPLSRAFREEAFTAGEVAEWEAFTADGGGGERAACAAFAAKEAAVKWLGTGLSVPLLGLRVTPAGAGSPGRLGGLHASAFELDVRGPGVSRRLSARLAAPGRLVVIAAWGPR